MLFTPKSASGIPASNPPGLTGDLQHLTKCRPIYFESSLVTKPEIKTALTFYKGQGQELLNIVFEGMNQNYDQFMQSIITLRRFFGPLVAPDFYSPLGLLNGDIAQHINY